MKYYGLVDIENLSYGFVEEADERITDKFIEITEEYHQQLLDEASTGLEIVSDNKTVFTAKPNLYFINSQGLWEKKNEEDYEAEQELKERERVNKLTCTKRVFALMLQELGITYSQLKELIASNEQAQLEWDLCVELERGNPLLDVMASQLGITSEQLDGLFKYANGEITLEQFKGII